MRHISTQNVRVRIIKQQTNKRTYRHLLLIFFFNFWHCTADEIVKVQGTSSHNLISLARLDRLDFALDSFVTWPKKRASSAIPILSHG